MTKKKNSRQKHQQDVGDPNTSDDEGNCANNKGCPHTSRAINLTKIKKHLRANPNIEKCMGCQRNPSKDLPDNDVLDNEVWLCLQCGHCGCGRNSPSQHAIVHHRTPRSDSHAIVLNTTSMCIWCYECDDEIQHRTSRIIRECVDLVKKSSTSSTSKKDSVYMNGSVTEIGRSSSVNDSMMKSVVHPEPVSLLRASKNPSEESTKGLSLKNSKKPDQNICKSSIKGLRNLGNTCFFNAVMQNLSQTPWLLNELEKHADKSYAWEIPFPVNGEMNLNMTDEGIKPLKVSLGDCYPLALALLNLLKQMNSQPRKSEVINPGNLFEQICKKSPQFRGFQQQDSHELLRHLLDGVRNEEIRRQKRGILKALSMEKVDRNSVDEETRQMIKAYGVYASHTVVEKIFGGQLLSTVLCEECKMSSQVFEPFMDLSLPLAEEKPMRANKSYKHEVSENYGMQPITKAKETDTKPSKHQERKMRQQARKAAKRQVKSSKTNNSTVPDEEQEPPNVSVENSSELLDSEQKSEFNNELSDADIEDNEDSESVCSKLSTVSPEKEVNGCSLEEGVCEDGMNCAQEMDDRLQELCSQITDIRIRRDSDRQDSFLDNLDSQMSCSRNQENKVTHNAADFANGDAESESWVHSQPDQLKKEWLLKSLTTVKPRYQPSAHECSVNSCLNQFTASELLTGSNKFRCENCTSLKQEATGRKSEVVYSNASKRLLIFSPPAVLTLHLKRFQQTGMSLRKLNLFVEFPCVLDLAPYCSSVCLKLPHMAGVRDEILYSLYGIVQHSGRLSSGHYTAFVRASKNHLNPAFLNNWPMGQCSLDQLLEKIKKVKTQFNEMGNNISNEGKQIWYYVSDGHFSEVSEAEVFKCQAYILFYERIK